MENLKLEGNDYYSNNDFNLAIEKYKEALHLSTSNIDSSILHSNISSSYCNIEEYDLALEHAKEAIKLNISWFKGWFRLSSVLFKQGKIDEAKKAMTKTLEICDRENISKKYILDLKENIFNYNNYKIFDNEDLKMPKDFRDNFSPFMSSMLNNSKIKEKLNNPEFKDKMLKNRNNPMSMLGDPDMAEVMAEMMKNFNR
tara:strand:+ start:878 stop:1474 length:597 start_codon:yes stop_codon:yes gene_type:complete